MSIAAMIASIKFNDRRNKRESFGHISGKSDKESHGIKIEPVSDEVLQEIRDKLERQNTKERLRFILILLISIITTILFIFFCFEYFENSVGISGDFLYRNKT